MYINNNKCLGNYKNNFIIKKKSQNNRVRLKNILKYLIRYVIAFINLFVIF